MYLAQRVTQKTDQARKTSELQKLVQAVETAPGPYMLMRPNLFQAMICDPPFRCSRAVMEDTKLKRLGSYMFFNQSGGA